MVDPTGLEVDWEAHGTGWWGDIVDNGDDNVTPWEAAYGRTDPGDGSTIGVPSNNWESKVSGIIGDMARRFDERYGDLGDRIESWKMSHNVYENAATWNNMIAGLTNKQNEYADKIEGFEDMKSDQRQAAVAQILNNKYGYNEKLEYNALKDADMPQSVFNFNVFNNSYFNFIGFNDFDIAYSPDYERLKSMSLTYEEVKENDRELFNQLQQIDLMPWGIPGEFEPEISSYFGERKSPFNFNILEWHPGIDIFSRNLSNANGPCPVIAGHYGTVVETGLDKIYGFYVVVKYDKAMIDYQLGYKSKLKTIRTYYGHMDRLVVKEGDYVYPGSILGRMWSFGRATGPHVDIRVSYGDKYVDPFLFNIKPPPYYGIPNDNPLL